MKKQYIIIGIVGVVLLVAGFMYFSFGGASRGIQKVISNDGLAELTIPKNALPEGMSIKDISITNVSVDDSMIAYELKPDGTAFSAPLTFKTTFKNKDNVIPVPFLISREKGIELVSDVETTLDLTKNEATISMPMAHFSGVVFSTDHTGALFNATMNVPAQVYIEDIVSAKVILNKIEESEVISNLVNERFNRAAELLGVIGENRPKGEFYLTFVSTGYRLIRDSVKINGKLSADWFIFAPDKIFDNRPALTAFTGETFTVESSDYRCEKLGFGSMYFTLGLTYEVEEFQIPSGGPLVRRSVDGTVTLSKRLECVARPSVLDGTGSGVSESESKAIGDILETASADPARVECPGTDYLSPDGGGVSIDVFKLNDGKCYPVRQFGNSSPPDKCAEPHFHTQLTSLDGAVRNDSQPCGAAVQSDIVKSGAIYISPAQMNKIK